MAILGLQPFFFFVFLFSNRIALKKILYNLKRNQHINENYSRNLDWGQYKGLDRLWLILKIRRRKGCLWQHGALLPKEAEIPGMHTQLHWWMEPWAALCRRRFQVPRETTPLWPGWKKNDSGSSEVENLERPKWKEGPFWPFAWL